MNRSGERFILEQLSRLPLFLNLPEEALEVVAAAAHRKEYEEGNFLFYQDDPAKRVFTLMEGRARLAQLAPDGQQVIMRVATPWMLIATISLVPGAVYPVSAEAAEVCHALYWTQAEMLALIERYPLLALNAMRLLAGHVREIQDRYRELATERVERRLARAVLRLADQAGRETEEGVLLDLPITRQDLAEMTGTTLYTVSRTLSRWESQGLVYTGRERIVIRVLDGLVNIAEDLPSPTENRQNSPE